MYDRAAEIADHAGDRGLEAEMLINLAAAVRKEHGPEEAERLAERSVEAAQKVLHYDTAFAASSSMADWFLEDENWEKAGEWAANSLLFGPLLGDEMGLWANWIVSALSDLTETEGRDRFLTAMDLACRRLEEENDLVGELTPVVDAVRSRFARS